MASKHLKDIGFWKDPLFNRRVGVKTVSDIVDIPDDCPHCRATLATIMIVTQHTMEPFGVAETHLLTLLCENPQCNKLYAYRWRVTIPQPNDGGHASFEAWMDELGHRHEEDGEIPF